MTRSCLVLGNSVAMRVRGGQGKKNYSDLLCENGFNCRNAGKAGSMITEVFLYLDDEIVCKKYDYIILNFGIVEIYSRNTFRAFNNLFVSNKYNNSVLGQTHVSAAERKVVNIIRPILVSLHLLRKIVQFDYTWISLARYFETLGDLIAVIRKETDSRIILMGVHKIEQDKDVNSKKINRRIAELNNHYEMLSVDDDIQYLDIENHVRVDRHLHSPDGIHYSASFHRLVSELLTECMEEDNELF